MGVTEATRESKPLQISNCLARMGKQILLLEEFVDSLLGPLNPKGESGKDQAIVPTFNEIYQGLPEILNSFSGRIEKVRDSLKELLI